MVPLYIFGGLVVVGIVALIVLKTKWGRADRAQARRRGEKIEEERIEEAGRAEVRRRKGKIKEERMKE